MIKYTGDSATAVKSGWGPGFCADAVPELGYLDMAKGGRSTMAPPPVAAAGAANGDSVPAPKPPTPGFDYTHLGDKGPAYFCRMAANESTAAVPDLRPVIQP